MLNLSRTQRAILLATQWIAEERNFPRKELLEAIVETPQEAPDEGSIPIRIGVRNIEKEYIYLAFDVTPETKTVILVEETD